MKNKLTILLIIALLISIFFNMKQFFYNKQAKDITDIKIVSFEQKQQCAPYKKGIEDRFEKENKVKYSDREIVKSLERVFYSPKSSSCLALYKENYYKIGTNDRDYDYVLEDILTGEIISNKTIFRDETGKKNMLDFYKILKEFELNTN